MKVCSKCGIEKDEGEFGKDKKNKDGMYCQCKLCRKEYCKQYYENNKEYYKQHFENNKEYYKEKQKEYRRNNKQYFREYLKEWRKNNKKYAKEHSKEWRKNNKEHNEEYHKNNIKTINGENYNINTVPDELKPIIKQLIDIKNAKIKLREKRKKIEKGEI